MRYELRAAFGAAILLVTASTGCSGGEGSSARPSGTATASAAAPTPTPSALTEVINRSRDSLLTSGAVGADTPGPEGLMLVEAWPRGAAFTWETRDERLCWASASAYSFGERGCVDEPIAVQNSRAVHSLATLFTDGVVSLFAADHQQVTSATCGGTRLEVRRVGTIRQGARTLYAVRFSDYTKGSITLALSHDGTKSEAPFSLGDIGDRNCAAS